MAQTEYTTAVLADTPAAFWLLNDTSGLPQDSSGNARHFTASSGSFTYEAGAPFSGAQSIRFNVSSNSAVFSIAHTFFSTDDDWTLEAWVKVATIGANTQIGVGRGDATLVYAMSLRSTAGQARLSGTNPGGAPATAPNLLDCGFRHVAVRNSGGTGDTWLDGDIHSTTTAAGGVDTLWRLGASSGGSTTTVDMYVSNFAIYTSALSASRIRAHYNAAIGWTAKPLINRTASGAVLV